MVNRKAVQRIWREEGLRVPPHPPKRRRLGHSTVAAKRLTAEGLTSSPPLATALRGGRMICRMS